LLALLCNAFVLIWIDYNEGLGEKEENMSYCHDIGCVLYENLGNATVITVWISP
jgi:hypothetical protein